MQEGIPLLLVAALLAGCVAPDPSPTSQSPAATASTSAAGTAWDQEFMEHEREGRFLYLIVEGASGDISPVGLPGEFSSIRGLTAMRVAVSGFGDVVVVDVAPQSTIAHWEGHLLAATPANVYFEGRNLTSVLEYNVETRAVAEIWTPAEPCRVLAPGSISNDGQDLALTVQCQPLSGGWDAALTLVSLGDSARREYKAAKEPEFAGEGGIVFVSQSGIERLDLETEGTSVLQESTSEKAFKRPIFPQGEDLAFIRSDYRNPSPQVHGFQRTLVSESLIFGDEELFRTEKFIIRDFDVLGEHRIAVVLQVRE